MRAAAFSRSPVTQLLSDSSPVKIRHRLDLCETNLKLLIDEKDGYTACPKENTTSHLITEVKSCWAGLISGWEAILVCLC